jgi:hypothetical protein
MANPKPTDAEWAVARRRYETKYGVGLAEIARTLGVSKGNAGGRAKAEGWVKCSTREVPAPNDTAEDAGKVEESAAPARERAPPVYSAPPTPQAVEVSALRDEQAEVLALHRKEGRALRALAYKAMKSVDPEQSRTTKVLAETIAILHSIERKAWSLDGEPNGRGGRAAPGRIIINRIPGAKLV